jgi:hypothetical protein
MRKLVIAAGIILAIWTAIIYAYARQAEAVSENNIDCSAETLRLKIAVDQNVVFSIRQSGIDLILTIYSKAWLGLFRIQQKEIGLAAYCGVALQAKGGMVRIVDINGDEYARVVKGHWSSRISGE